MIDPKVFNTCAQTTHVLGGCLAVIGSVYLFGPDTEWIAAGVMSLFVACKEFGWDYHHETPEVRGSSLEDAVFYLFGIGLAVLLIFAKAHL